MAAWTLFRRATGMKDARSVRRRQAGQIQFLERRRGNGGDLRPVRNLARCGATSLREVSIRRVAGKLQREQFECELVEKSITPEGRVTRVPILVWDFRAGASCNLALRKNAFAQTRGEI